MLESAVSQYVELAKLDEELTAMRARAMRAGLANEGPASLTEETERESREILERVKEQHRSDEWKANFPPAPEEPNEQVTKVMMSSRDVAMDMMLDLHLAILAAPVVGCESDGEPED